MTSHLTYTAPPNFDLRREIFRLESIVVEGIDITLDAMHSELVRSRADTDVQTSYAEFLSNLNREIEGVVERLRLLKLAGPELADKAAA